MIASIKLLKSTLSWFSDVSGIKDSNFDKALAFHKSHTFNDLSFLEIYLSMVQWGDLLTACKFNDYVDLTVYKPLSDLLSFLQIQLMQAVFYDNHLAFGLN